ncbi:deoxyribodipyrimidine photo-lyase [Iodidimonas sp. SYSU 1G8]|uniref:cryptochrome/photolyase family protein n=1 Tax=Iodidimonas sp. SYSU 1G8 TaxID=3133967 RepID=UPI0031FF04B2
MTTSSPLILWFRSDLRLADHPALMAAARTGRPVIPVFVLDEGNRHAAPGAASRWWLHHSLTQLSGALGALASRLVLRRGNAARIMPDLLRETGAGGIVASASHEPRQRAVERLLTDAGVPLRLFAGNHLFPPGTILNGSGAPYRVFTPFYKACLNAPPPAAPLDAPAAIAAPGEWPGSDRLEDWDLLPRAPDWAGGLRETWTPGEAGAAARLEAFLDRAAPAYDTARDLPAQPGTSRLSPHLHFGEISARQVWHAATHHPDAGSTGMATFLREIGWREFSCHLLHHCPEMTHRPLRAEFENFPWRDDPAGLRAWQRGETGYPIVDAGMRELWHTGFMHNRVRMIAASFLVKDLRIDWRRGAAWFLDTLVDADTAANSSNWQWVAGCGTDAAPYFRVFNPALQARKFDPEGGYIRRWVPELGNVPAAHVAEPWSMMAYDREAIGLRLGQTYPHRIVDHGEARKAALAALGEMNENASVLN